MIKDIAKKLLFAILDAIIPILLDELKDQADVIDEYVEQKKSQILDKLTPEEIRNEVADVGKWLRERF